MMSVLIWLWSGFSCLGTEDIRLEHFHLSGRAALLVAVFLLVKLAYQGPMKCWLLLIATVIKIAKPKETNGQSVLRHLFTSL